MVQPANTPPQLQMANTPPQLKGRHQLSHHLSDAASASTAASGATSAYHLLLTTYHYLLILTSMPHQLPPPRQVPLRQSGRCNWAQSTSPHRRSSRRTSCQPTVGGCGIQQPQPMMLMPHRVHASRHADSLWQQLQPQPLEEACCDPRSLNLRLAYLPSDGKELPYLGCKLEKMSSRVPDLRSERSCVVEAERRLSYSVAKSTPPTSRTRRVGSVQEMVTPVGKRGSLQPRGNIQPRGSIQPNMCGSLAEDVPSIPFGMWDVPSQGQGRLSSVASPRYASEGMVMMSPVCTTARKHSIAVYV